MVDFTELKALVKKKGFGKAEYGNVNGQAVLLSRGVREVFMDEDGIQKVLQCVSQFQKGYFGDAAEHGKNEKSGHEYGRYEIGEFENAADEDTAVWVHRAEDSVLVYFAFER